MSAFEKTTGTFLVENVFFVRDHVIIIGQILGDGAIVRVGDAVHHDGLDVSFIVTAMEKIQTLQVVPRFKSWGLHLDATARREDFTPRQVLRLEKRV